MRSHFIKTNFTVNLSSWDKTRLPVDPFMAFMNASWGKAVHMEGSDLSGVKLLELLSLVKRGLRRRGFNLKTKHLLRSTQPFSTLKKSFFFGFKRDNKKHKCHNAYLSQHIGIGLSCVTSGPVPVRSLRAASATLAARSAPCQTPGCSSQSAL